MDQKDCSLKCCLVPRKKKDLGDGWKKNSTHYEVYS